jgi:hypothetical protein
MVLAKPVSATGREPMARIAAATMVGTAVEYYDFYLYTSVAALIFGPLFFPKLSAAGYRRSGPPRTGRAGGGSA